MIFLSASYAKTIKIIIKKFRIHISVKAQEFVNHNTNTEYSEKRKMELNIQILYSNIKNVASVIK